MHVRPIYEPAECRRTLWPFLGWVQRGVWRSDWLEVSPLWQLLSVVFAGSYCDIAVYVLDFDYFMQPRKVYPLRRPYINLLLVHDIQRKSPCAASIISASMGALGRISSIRLKFGLFNTVGRRIRLVAVTSHISKSIFIRRSQTLAKLFRCSFVLHFLHGVYMLWAQKVILKMFCACMMRVTSHGHFFYCCGMSGVL